MLRALGTMIRLPRYSWAKVRRHPVLAIALALVIAAGAGVAVWQYALFQWRAAQTALREDRAGEARERLQFCLNVWPRSTEVHLLAARADRISGNLSDAEGHLNRCLELEGGATEGVQLEFLLIRVQTGELDGEKSPASILMGEVEKGHPEAAAILETVARAYIQRLRYWPAYRCLSFWVDLEPDSPKPYQWRGLVRERLNNHKGAMEDYLLALERNPDLLPVRLRVAEMLLEDKQAPEALPHLEYLLRQAPNDPMVQARLGMCRYLQGRTEDARRLMEGALPHIPKDPALIVALANLDLQDGRGAEAEKRLRTLLETDPSDTEALFVLSSTLRFLGRTEDAAAVLADYESKRATVDRINNLLKDVADSATAKADDYAEIGRLFFQIGREKFGVYWSELALERDPKNHTANTALAEHYERKGNRDSAAVHRSQARPSIPALSKKPNP